MGSDRKILKRNDNKGPTDNLLLRQFLKKQLCYKLFSCYLKDKILKIKKQMNEEKNNKFSSVNS
ncbi:MAG: hypothetical protein KAR05_02705 [Candidatus Omnitrophica bacterium]|nr:hypothetical protein [Candidatus Omnitrophota bacterium]